MTTSPSLCSLYVTDGVVVVRVNGEIDTFNADILSDSLSVAQTLATSAVSSTCRGSRSST